MNITILFVSFNFKRGDVIKETERNGDKVTGRNCIGEKIRVYPVLTG